MREQFLYVRTFDPGEKMHDNEACDVYRVILGGTPVHMPREEVLRRLIAWVEANN